MSNMYMPGMQLPYSTCFRICAVDDPRSDAVIPIVEKKVRKQRMKAINIASNQHYIRQKTYRVKYRKND